MKLSYFPIPASLCRHVRGGNGMGGIRHSLYVKRPYVRYLSTMKDTEERECMREKSLTDNCQTRARRGHYMISLAWMGSNITIE